ncbi:hypothetical protein [Ligilactobacillus aviarius]|nr:hypothetical protein [Ligilactobacillus aviarius]
MTMVNHGKSVNLTVLGMPVGLPASRLTLVQHQNDAGPASKLTTDQRHR